MEFLHSLAQFVTTYSVVLWYYAPMGSWTHKRTPDFPLPRGGLGRETFLCCACDIVHSEWAGAPQFQSRHARLKFSRICVWFDPLIFPDFWEGPWGDFSTRCCSSLEDCSNRLEAGHEKLTSQIQQGVMFKSSARAKVLLDRSFLHLHCFVHLHSHRRKTCVTAFCAQQSLPSFTK